MNRIAGEAARRMKIASLLPAATEMLHAIGAGDLVAGISHECDHPARLSGLPRLTRSRLRVDGVSGKIHESVSALVEHALSVYEVDVERLKALAPDVIITQDLCDVCAVSYDDVRAAVAEFTDRDVQIIRLHPKRLADVYRDIERIGNAVGRIEQAANLVAALKARMAYLRETTRDLPSKSVLLVEWLQPVMAGGLWSADLAGAVNARALASAAGVHARTLNRDELAGLDPDVVVIKPCGFDLNRTGGELSAFAEYFPWSEWRAVKGERVFIADGNAYFNRPGPRIVDSAEILAACVHEQEFARFRTQYSDGVRRIRRDLSLTRFDA